MHRVQLPPWDSPVRLLRSLFPRIGPCAALTLLWVWIVHCIMLHGHSTLVPQFCAPLHHGVEHVCSLPLLYPALLRLCLARNTGKRQLVRSNRDIWVVGTPFLMWGIMIIILYAISITLLDSVS